MDLSLLEGGERNPIYQRVATDNSFRHYHFLHTLIEASVAAQWKPVLSEATIKAINFHAIVVLHSEAGMYRSGPVFVGNYTPPSHHEVESLMREFVDEINRRWENTDALSLAAFALWRINNIHPFVNGNGRTARAVCYFILCTKVGGPLPGEPILPELLRDSERQRYVQALKAADATDGNNITALIDLINELVLQQLGSS